LIDTGLHSLGCDVTTEVTWMMDHSSITRDHATAEVERYVAIPGRALSYKIRELRRRAELDVGTRFDIKAFHDQILLGGSIPSTTLEARVERWISAARAR
jgi:uncharacterized protein (DUF885 family)